MNIRHRTVLMLIAAALFIGAAARAQAPPTIEGIAVALDDKNLTLRQANGEERQVGKPQGWETVRPGEIARVESAIPPKLTVIGGVVYGTVGDIATDHSSMLVKARAPRGKPPRSWTNHGFEGLMKSNDGPAFTLSLSAGNSHSPMLKSMRVGDVVRVSYQREGEAGKETNALKSVDWRADPVGAGWTWLFFAGAAGALLLVAIGFTRGHPTHLFLGLDNRYSSSKFQTVVWFWVVISAYLAIVAQRVATADWGFLGGVEIPQNLLVLSGISVLSFAASKAITTGKVDAAKATTGEDPKPPATAPKASDLVSDDVNRTDLGDFQMLVMTAIAVAMYAASTIEFLSQIEFRKTITMPDVDSALLALFGLGQAAFLGKKVVGGAGAGMSPEQAIQRIDEVAQTAKSTADKADTASKSAMTCKTEAATALSKVQGQQTQATAKPGAEEARDAARRANEAVVEASIAVKAAQAQVAEADKLATQWLKVPTVGQPIQLSLDAAKKERDRAIAAESSAANSAKDAEASAKKAQEHLKTLP